MANLPEINLDGLPVASFTDLWALAQKGLFAVVFGAGSFVAGSGDYRDAAKAIEDLENDYGLGNRPKVREVLDKVAELISDLREDGHSGDASSTASAALDLVHQVNNLYGSDDDPIDFEVAHTKLEEARQLLYEAWKLEFNERPHFLYEFALWIDWQFRFGAAFEDEFKHGDDFRDLHYGYLPALERRLANQEEDIEYVLPFSALAGVRAAVEHLQWVDAQTQNATDVEQEIILPRLDQAYHSLLPLIEPEIRHVTTIYTDKFLEEIFPGLVKTLDFPSAITLRAEMLVTILTRVDAYLKAHPAVLEDLDTVFQRLSDSLNDTLAASDAAKSIWETLRDRTALGAWWTRLKQLYTDARREIAKQYFALPNEFDDLRVGARAITEIRDILKAQAQKEQDRQAEIDGILAQHKQAAQDYLTQNAGLFEPPPPVLFDALPFVELPPGTTRKATDAGGTLFFLPDGTVLRVSAGRDFSAVLPDSIGVEPLAVQTDNTVKLSDTRVFRLLPQSVPPTSDATMPGLPVGSTVTVTALVREASLPSGERVRYYPADDLVAALLPDGSEALVSFTNLNGLGTSGTLDRVSDTLRRFRFTNAVTGTVDWLNGFDVLLPSGAIVAVRRTRTGFPGQATNAPTTHQPFICRRCES